MNAALKEYLEYLESENEFSYTVRMEREWNDREYEKCITLLLRVINSYKNTGVIPTAVVLFFTGLERLIGQVSHPDFFHGKDLLYKELVERRKDELLELHRKFCSGELFTAGSFKS